MRTFILKEKRKKSSYRDSKWISWGYRYTGMRQRSEVDLVEITGWRSDIGKY